MEISQELNRIPPNMTPDAYQTYRVLAPTRTHWRPATCEEVNCDSFINGWRTIVDENTELGQKQAYFIRHDKERSATAIRTPEGLTEFTFSPGQPCFLRRQHKTRVGRLDLFVVDGGDFRGNPRGTPRVVHTKPEFWVEDMQETFDEVNEVIKRG